MTDAAFCITLLLTVFLQLGAREVAFQIVPNRLQFFEYESVSFKCEGLAGRNVFRKVKNETSACGGSKWGTSNESSCTIKNVYPDDSGKYWCEAAGERRGNSVNITITASNVSVILKSPPFPVTEGDAATLHCRNKTSTNLPAAFYKDGRLIESSSTREMTIRSVSKSYEGLYRCSISGAGGSAESWLAVRESSSNPPSSTSTPWIVVTILLLLVLLAVGLLHLAKGYHHRVLLYLSTLLSGLRSADDQTEAAAAAADTAVYAAVTKGRKREAADDSMCGAVYYALSLGDPLQMEPAADISPALTENPLYSSIQ